MLTAFAPGPSRLPIAAWTKAWVAGTSPAMTAVCSPRPPALPNAHENRRAQDLRRRQSAARVRRPLLPVPQAQDRLRDRGRRRGLCGELRPEGDRGDDRGRIRASCRGRRSVPDRSLMAQRLWPRLFGPARHFADGRACPESRWRCGTSSARQSASRSTRCSAARSTSGCAATPISIPTSPARTPIPTALSIPIRTQPPSGRSSTWRKASPR